MRKCVSMVAVASAAFGLAACSSPDQHREPAGAAQPPSGPGSSAAVRAEKVHAAPAVPAASGAVSGRPGPQGQNPQPGRAGRHDPGTSVAAPVLIPSGTTDVAAQPGHPGAAGAGAPGRPAAAARARVPAAPRPAPTPPAADSPAYDPSTSMTAQIVDAVAAHTGQPRYTEADVASWLERWAR